MAADLEGKQEGQDAALEQNMDRSGVASVAGSVDRLTCTAAVPLSVSLEPVWTAGWWGW